MTSKDLIGCPRMSSGVLGLPRKLNLSFNILRTIYKKKITKIFGNHINPYEFHGFNSGYFRLGRALAPRSPCSGPHLIEVVMPRPSTSKVLVCY